MDDTENQYRSGRRLGWDAIVFILLWASLFWSSWVSGLVTPSNQFNMTLIVFLTRVLTFDPVAGLLVILLASYIAADLWAGERTQFRIKLFAIWGTIFAFVILPTIAAIVYRHNSAPHLYIHDGAIQVEEAVKFLFAGKNPYAMSYASTPMAQWAYHEPDLSLNPYMQNLLYLPLMVLIPAPFFAVSQLLTGWFDIRFVHLILLVVGVFIISRAGRTRRDGLVAAMLFSLNPLFVPFFIEGRNDIFVSFWLVVAISFLQVGRLGWAGVMLGLAAATKQTAWFLLPFYALFVIGCQEENAPLRTRIGNGLRTLIPSGLTMILVFAPFLIWNPIAFFMDVLILPSGASNGAIASPISSLGLGSLALGLGWVKRSIDPFPFVWLQLPLVVMALIFLLWQFWQNRTLPQMFASYILLLFVYMFFGRLFNDNYLGFALSWLVLSSLIGEARQAREREPESRRVVAGASSSMRIGNAHSN